MYKCKSLQVGQLPQKYLFCLRNLLIFTITKYLRQEAEDDLSICVDERSPCGIPIAGDKKIYQCHVIKRK